MWVKAAGLVAGVAAVVAAGSWQYAERTRVIEGTWLHMFEGSDFFEEQRPGRECDLYRSKARRGWLEYSLEAANPRYKIEHPLPNTGTYSSQYGEWPLDAFAVRFEGRRRLKPLGGGHLGLWQSEYEVHRMLTITPIPGLACDVR